MGRAARVVVSRARSWNKPANIKVMLRQQRHRDQARAKPGNAADEIGPQQNDCGQDICVSLDFQFLRLSQLL